MPATCSSRVISYLTDSYSEVSLSVLQGDA